MKKLHGRDTESHYTTELQRPPSALNRESETEGKGAGLTGTPDWGDGLRDTDARGDAAKGGVAIGERGRKRVRRIDKQTNGGVTREDTG